MIQVGNMKNSYEKCDWCEGPVQTCEGPADRIDWCRWRCKKCHSYGYIKNPDSEDLSLIYQSAFDNLSSEGDFAIVSTSFDISKSSFGKI